MGKTTAVSDDEIRVLSDLCQRLAGHGYYDPTVLMPALGYAPTLMPPSASRYDFPSELKPLHTAAKLFLLGVSVPVREATELLPNEVLESLKRVGLFQIQGVFARSRYCISPWMGLSILSDPGSRIGEDDFISGPDNSTAILAQFALPRFSSGRRVLDLGTGTGVIALLAARMGCKVRGLDISQHAAYLAELNAAVNGLEAEFVTQDICAGELAGEFDVVVGNLPGIYDVCTWDTPFFSAPGQTLLQSIYGRLNDIVAAGGEAVLRHESRADDEKLFDHLAGWSIDLLSAPSRAPGSDVHSVIFCGLKDERERRRRAGFVGMEQASGDVEATFQSMDLLDGDWSDLTVRLTPGAILAASAGSDGALSYSLGHLPLTRATAELVMRLEGRLPVSDVIRSDEDRERILGLARKSMLILEKA